MPCRDGRENMSSSEIRNAELESSNYTLSKDVTKLKEDNYLLIDKNIYLSACLCALLSEIEKEQRLDIIENAQDNGKVDINSFWQMHQIEDIERLKTKLMEYSAHELTLIKSILNAAG